MASSISKTVNINDLPVETDISSNDYIIVQNELKTYRVKFMDIIINKDNTTFGQEINELYVRMNEMNTMITQLKEELAQEKLRSSAAETQLASQIIGAKEIAIAHANTITTAERTRSMSEDNALSSRLTQNSTNISNEIARAKSKESSIQSEIDAHQASNTKALESLLQNI